MDRREGEVGDDTPAARAHFSGLSASLNHTLPQLIRHVATRYGDHPFVIGEDGATLTFAGFAAEVEQLGEALIKHHISVGDRVAIWGPNSAKWIVAASAIESIGAILVPINTRFKGAEAAYVLAKTGAKLLFTVEDFLGADYARMLRDACGGGTDQPAADLPSLGHVIRLDQANFIHFIASGAGQSHFRDRAAAVAPRDIADILFTSGTTGRPKGAMHAHGQALWMVAHWNRANDLRHTDRMLIVNPFFHSFGYRSGWVSALAAGITAYPMAIFDATAVLKAISVHRITVLMGPPMIFRALIDHPDFATHDLSSLRCGHTGSANVPVDLIRAARETLGFDIFLTSFGQTESTALISVNLPGDDAETIARTVGRPVPGVELKIVDADGGVQPHGASGELLVRGPNVMRGYYDDPEQTAATIDADGWLRTGDVGAIGPDGRLRIVDRLKDVVIVGGFNAYPAEIEAMLREHPAIADVAIVAWPDDRLGEVCAACVILNKGASLDEVELVRWSRERMANYKAPRRLFIVPEFPRTPLGKVQKFALREQMVRGHR